MRKMVDVGEKKFLSEILPKLQRHSTFVNGFGHDASVVDVGLDAKNVVLKIDRAASPIATRKGWTDYKLWGRLAVVSNCSDILAVGGEPKGVMLSLVLPHDWPVEDAEQIIEGCSAACLEHDVAFLGGDTKEGKVAQVVGCAVGTIHPDQALNRDSGRPGDLLVLAGELGGYVGAFLQLDAEAGVPSVDPDRVRFLQYVNQPEARWCEAQLINSLRAATAATDLSDGLLDALKSLTRCELGAEIDLDAVPFHEFAHQASRVFDIPLFNFAFGVGDWGILYCMSRAGYERLRANITDKMVVSAIGQVTDLPGLFARDNNGKRFKIDGIVNEHFRERMEDAGSFMDSIRNNVSLLEV